MRNLERTPLRAAVLGAAMTMLAAMPALAGSLVNTDADNVAIEGYDPVAYFTEEQAVPGDPALEHVWQGARWRFAKPEHKQLFAAAPDRYAPRYGGFCAGAMTVGMKATIDPEAWAIIDDKLFLAFRKAGIDNFAEEPEDHIAEADAHWQRLQQAN